MTEVFDLKLFSTRLTELRKKKNMTFAMLADKVKTSKSTIYDYEKAKHKPTIDIVFLLADALDCPVAYLLNLGEAGTFQEGRKDGIHNAALVIMDLLDSL